MAKAPEYVALPEVNEYSEVIRVGELGLPVGFDMERLQLNVARTERIARFADLGALSIEGFRGDTTEYSYGIGGMSQGIATVTKSAVMTRAKMYETKIDRDEQRLSADYVWGNAKLRINNAEIEQRIVNDGEKWQRGVFDAAARAKYINLALKNGLAKTATEHQLNGDVPGNVIKSVLKTAAGTAWYHYMVTLSPVDAFMLYEAVSSSPVDHAWQKYVRHGGYDVPPRQWSMFPRIHYDRYLAVQGLARTTKLVRAR